MSLATTLAVALLSGLALGAVYFAVLRWSLQRLAAGGSALPMILALAGRLALAAAVLLLATLRGGWPAVLAALGGFLLVRTAVTWRRGGESVERHA